MVESTGDSGSDNQPEGERPSAGTAPSPSPMPAPTPPGSPMGRRAGAIVYWLLITFVIGFGVRSITTQVFWPRADAAPPATTCREGIRSLAAELHAFAAGVAARPSETAPMQDGAFLGAWGVRYNALDPLCEGDAARDAYGTLARYRYSLEQSLVRHRRDETELSRDLDARLAALRP